VVFKSGCASVRGAHPSPTLRQAPSKIAKGGAAFFVVPQEWASPHWTKTTIASPNSVESSFSLAKRGLVGSCHEPQ
jgi:hypothetical protein